MLFLCVNVYCHRVTTQLQLINIIIIITIMMYLSKIYYVFFDILYTERKTMKFLFIILPRSV